MKVLVTGGSGYFGSLLVELLREKGYQADSLDINDADDRPEEVTFHQVDIRDGKTLTETVNGYEVIFHNVAQVPLAKNLSLFSSVNIDGTRNICNAALEAGCRKLVYTSSSAVFGVPKENPVTEKTEPRPGEAYGRAKLEGERICRKSSEAGLDLTIIRPRTILGHGRLGIFQILFEWVRQGIRIPVLNGGGNVYQFVHARDLADACAAASERPVSTIYNIGADQFGTMRESLEGLCRYASTGSTVFLLPMKPVEWMMNLSSSLGLSPLGPYHALMYGRSLYFDTAKARQELNFRPAYSNLEMLIESYEWYLRNRKRLNAQKEPLSHHRTAVNEGILKLMRLF